MALWQNATTFEQWDDGLTAAPGDPDFTDITVKAKWPDGFNYLGTPNWQAPVDQASE